MNQRTPKRLPARFYRTDSGREPVRQWPKSLEAQDRRIIGQDVKDVEGSWPIGMPLVRSLGRELWEVRSSLPYRPRDFLHRERLNGASAWLPKENAENT